MAGKRVARDRRAAVGRREGDLHAGRALPGGFEPEADRFARSLRLSCGDLRGAAGKMAVRARQNDQPSVPRCDPQQADAVRPHGPRRDFCADGEQAQNLTREEVENEEALPGESVEHALIKPEADGFGRRFIIVNLRWLAPEEV